MDHTQMSVYSLEGISTNTATDNNIENGSMSAALSNGRLYTVYWQRLVCIRDGRVSEQPLTGRYSENCCSNRPALLSKGSNRKSVFIKLFALKSFHISTSLCSLFLFSLFDFEFHSQTLCVWETFLTAASLNMFVPHGLISKTRSARELCLARCSARFLFTHTVCAWFVHSNTYCSR